MEKFLESMGAVAEMVALYYTCLVKAGVPEEAATILTGMFQENILNLPSNRKEKNEDAE